MTLNLGAILFTADRHFNGITGLRVQDYSAGN
jgi:hypothetical protein